MPYIDHVNKNNERIEIISKPLSDSIADEFSESMAYSVGDVVMHEGGLYEFKTAHSAGVWNQNQVDAVKINDKIVEIQDNVAESINEIGDDLNNLANVVDDKILEVREDVNETIDYHAAVDSIITGAKLETNWRDGYAYKVPSTVTQLWPIEPVTVKDFTCMCVQCQPGDIFYITGTGGGGEKLWAWLTSDGNIISRADSNAEEENKKIIAPSNSEYLLVSMYETKKHMLISGNELISEEKSTLSGNPIFINDNKIDYIDGVECDGSQITCINLDYSIIRSSGSAKRHGLTFINDKRGILEFGGIHNDTSSIGLYWDGYGFTEARANAKPFIKSDGSDFVFVVKFNNNTIIDANTKFSFGIFEIGTTNITTLVTQQYDRIRDTAVVANTANIHNRFIPVAGKEYGLVVIIDFNPSDGGLNVNIGKTRVSILYGNENDNMFQIYTKFNVPIICYKNTMIATYWQNNIIVKYNRNNTNNKYAIFQTIASQKRSCCNLITDYQGEHSVLFDLSDATANDDVIGLITGKHVKAIVVSHMHYDHVGMNPNGATYSDVTFFNKLREVIDDDCIIYVQRKPAESENVPQSWRDSWQSTVDLLGQAGIPWIEVPTENYKVNIGDFILTFVNVDISEYNNTSYGGYNATSLCTFVDYYDNSVFITGDIYPTTQRRLYDVNLLKHANILLAPHHGLASKISNQFMSQIDPDVIVMNWGTSKSTSINTYTTTRGYSSAIRVWAEQYNVPVFDTYENETFNILMYQDGKISYDKLKTYESSGTVRHFSNVRDALQLEIPDDAMSDDSTASNMTLRELLLKLPRNSTLDCLMYGNYGVIADIFGRDVNNNSVIASDVVVIMHIDKMVGANSNNIFGRGNVVEWTDELDSQFVYHINAITEESVQKQREIVGRYRNNRTTDDEKWQEKYIINHSEIRNQVNDLTNNLGLKLDMPIENPYGISGQVLRSKGNGETEWTDFGLPSDEQTQEIIGFWLDEHPEATTTVQDKTISLNKLDKKTRFLTSINLNGMTYSDYIQLPVKKSYLEAITYLSPYYYTTCRDFTNNPNTNYVAIYNKSFVLQNYVYTDSIYGISNNIINDGEYLYIDFDNGYHVKYNTLLTVVNAVLNKGIRNFAFWNNKYYGIAIAADSVGISTYQSDLTTVIDTCTVQTIRQTLQSASVVYGILIISTTKGLFKFIDVETGEIIDEVRYYASEEIESFFEDYNGDIKCCGHFYGLDGVFNIGSFNNGVGGAKMEYHKVDASLGNFNLNNSSRYGFYQVTNGSEMNLPMNTCDYLNFENTRYVVSAAENSVYALVNGVWKLRSLYNPIDVMINVQGNYNMFIRLDVDGFVYAYTPVIVMNDSSLEIDIDLSDIFSKKGLADNLTKSFTETGCTAGKSLVTAGSDVYALTCVIQKTNLRLLCKNITKNSTEDIFAKFEFFRRIV